MSKTNWIILGAVTAVVVYYFWNKSKNAKVSAPATPVAADITTQQPAQ